LEFDVEMNVVVDDVLAEECEQSSGAVVAAKLRAVEFKLRLTGEMIGISGGNDSGKAQGLSNAAQGQRAMQDVVRCAGCAGLQRLCTLADELGSRKAVHGEEIVITEVAK